MAKIELVATEENFSPKVGDFFMQKDSKEIYILAKTSSDGYILICLNNGDRWTNVQSDISDVFGHIFKGKKSFTKIVTPFVITPE